MNKLDLKGKRFGKLVAIREVGRTTTKMVLWECQCDCGNIVNVRSVCLKNGHTTSCGCKTIEATIQRNLKHGESSTRLYKIWRGILRRTVDCKPTNPNWAKYAGRGISVCDEWKNSYEAFRDWSLSHGYSDALSIDRIDCNGNYEPNNCRWANDLVQANNRRNSVYVDFEGERKTISQWSKDKGINYHTLITRYYNGMNGAALFAPVKRCAVND